MQDALFPDDEEPSSGNHGRPGKLFAKFPMSTEGDVVARLADPKHLALARALPALARLGTSSWSFPGWRDLVWDGDYTKSRLAKNGLGAYAQHPLFRTVSLDRAFYRPLTTAQYAAYAAQVGDDFRFVVKAPALVTDASLRGGNGQALEPNPAFLDAEIAVEQFVHPALKGLGAKLGALVFQISPLPRSAQNRMPDLLQRLATMLHGLPDVASVAPDAVVAVEVRDTTWLTAEFAGVLKAANATYCLGLHAKLPGINEQLPMLRALWPGPLVCRWNLNRLHGERGYDDAVLRYQPFDQLVDADLPTRLTLAKIIHATTQGGQRVYVTVNNKAEGSAPLSVEALAKAVRALAEPWRHD